MISSFPISLGLSISLFIVLRFFIRNKSSALIASTISIILFSILIPDVASTSNKYWVILPGENFTSQDALRLHVFFSSLAILVLVMSFLEILLLTRKIRMTKSLSPPKNDQIPIETRYKTVFWLIGLSLFMLSVGLASGFFLDLKNADYLIIKIIFTILAWVTYTAAFIGMRFYNLKTKYIVRYSLVSIIFILIAFAVNV